LDQQKSAFLEADQPGILVILDLNLKDMKELTGLIFLVGLMAGCQKSDVVSDLTGNETTYALQQGSQYTVSGSIVFRERKDGKINAVIQLSGTDGDSKYPVHLHLGDITTTGADVALLMTPVTGKNGKSETIFNQLADESTITYNQLIGMNACVKIHLGDTGTARDIILAAGNIGVAISKTNSGGRSGGVSLCKSE